VKIVNEPSKDWIFVNQKTSLADPTFAKSLSYPQSDGKGYSIQKIPQVIGCLPLVVSDPEGCAYAEPETFVGIMLGDVNGNSGQGNSVNKLKRSSSNDPAIVFDLSHARLIGNQMEFPVYCTSGSDITSMDFEMKFNEEKITFNTIIEKVSYIETTFKYNENDKALRFLSYSLSKYEKEKNLVYIRFDLKNNAISKSDFQIPLSLINGEPVSVQITDYHSVISDVFENNLKPEINFYPNPATTSVILETTEDARVTMMDISGNPVGPEIMMLKSQKKEVSVENLSDGIYLVKFQIKGNTIVRKLIINK
jgi:hypothetical protein